MPSGSSDRGSVTAETAVVLPLVTALAAVLLATGSLIGVQLTTWEAARAGARVAARGADAAAVSTAVETVAGQDAVSEVSVSGPLAEVTVRRTLAPLDVGLLAGLELTLDARSVARLEPHLQEGP